MSVNFCHAAFQPDIRCDKVCVDGYEVTNLVSSGNDRNSPFLTESFIKPPVNVTVRFPCNVDVAKLVFNSAHGAQRSYGFEVYSYCGKRRASWLLDDVPMHPADNNEFKIFSPIGRGSDEDARVFCFVNKRYRERCDGGRRMPSRHQSSLSFAEFYLAHHYPKHTSSVSELTLRITRVAGSGVCAIRWLEIWGQPAYCCPPEVITKINALKAELFTPPPFLKFKQPDVSEKRTEDPAVDIPSEFLDPITQELMSVPVLLPSGNSVDQSTVDRHVEEEARWGRAPSDLFTGLLFSVTCKPVPNVSLKMRIDRFLLSSTASGIHVTKRRLGGDRAGTKPAASRLVHTDRRHVDGIPTTDDEITSTVTSHETVKSALTVGNAKNGCTTSLREYDDNVKCLTPGELDRVASTGKGPHRKRNRRSRAQSTGREVTIDLTSDDSRTSAIRLSTRETGSGGNETPNSVNIDDLLGKRRKRTSGDAHQLGCGDLSTLVDVAKQPRSGTLEARGEADISRNTAMKTKLPTQLQSSITSSDTQNTIFGHKNRSVGQLPPCAPRKHNFRTGTTGRHPKASHEQDVDVSLEMALTSALNGLPKFSRRDCTAIGKPQEGVFCACGADLKGHVFYRLECAHVICRRCLLNLAPSGGTVVCRICCRETASSKVLRIH